MVQRRRKGPNVPYLTLQAGLELQSDSSAGPGLPDRGMLSMEQEPGAAAGACGAGHGRGQVWCSPSPTSRGIGIRLKQPHGASWGLLLPLGAPPWGCLWGRQQSPQSPLGLCPSSHQPEGTRRAGWRSRTPADAPVGVGALLHPEIKPQRQGKQSHTFRRRGRRVIFIASFSLLLPIS